MSRPDPSLKGYQLTPFSEFLPQHRQDFTAIFWATSVRQQFASLEEKNNFQKKYFDDYLNSWPDMSLGIFQHGECAGYILGCSDTLRAIKEKKLAAGLYPPEFLPFLEKFPAHFHIDLAPKHQGQGLGPWAMGNWIKMLQNMGVPAVHVITMMEHPSYEFYQRQFFHELQRLPRDQRHLAILGRSLIDT